MTVEVMRIPVPRIAKRINLSISPNLSSGTDFTYIQKDGDNIKVRTDQLWFWSKNWQAGETKVDQHIANGETESFDSMEDFLSSLDD